MAARDGGGRRVYSTVDWRWTRAAERALTERARAGGWAERRYTVDVASRGGRFLDLQDNSTIDVRLRTPPILFGSTPFRHPFFSSGRRCACWSS